MDLGVSGLASGFDWRSLVDQLIEVERSPEKAMLSDQTRINQRNNAFGALKSELSVLLTRLKTLKTANFFATRATQSSDPTVGTATAGAATRLGQYTFNIIHLASASVQSGTANIGAALSNTDDVSALVVTDAAFPLAVKAGTFTVNGKQITLTAADTLQQVFDKISAATNGAVTAGYDSAADKITLSSASEIVLGSATDTSNFLAAARLANNGTGTVTSTVTLGGAKPGAALSAANLVTGVNDGGAGAGEFKINGVSISFNASTDSLRAVLDRINNSNAGVIASYDTRKDQVVLTSKATGDMGIALEDVTGNFLAATGLSGGTLTHGSDVVYSVNGGDELSSQSNTITEDSSGIAGLSFTALSLGQTTVTVSSDAETIKKALQDFIEQYNKVQSLIDTQTASTTDSKGKVTAGVLAQDSDADEIASRLRSLVFGQRSALTGSVKGLADLGYASNGKDNKLELDDEDKLSAALANASADVQSLFTDTVEGLATKLNDYLEKTAGDEGSLVTKQANLTKESAAIDTQISDMERLIADRRQQLIDSFLSMEEAQAKINQQLSYLSQRFGSSSTSSTSSK
jgi:flagellar hook-associated protein 2